MDICSLIKDVENREFYINKNQNGLCDNLQDLLNFTENENVFYVGTNQFVLDYYKDNPNSEWKIKSIFQLGFPFLFLGRGRDKKEELIRFFLEDEYWSLFVFTKSDFDEVFIGFNDIHRYSFKEEEYEDIEGIPNWQKMMDEKYGKPLFNQTYNDSYYFELINYVIDKGTIPEITDEMYEHHPIIFNSIPKENFFLRYLEYLSRYKKNVIDDFGLPNKNEKILPLKNLVQFVQEFTNKKDGVVCKERDIVTNGLFLDNYSDSVYGIIDVIQGKEQKDYNFIFRSFSLSPYYLWALLNSEFIKDYFFSTVEYFDFDPTPLKMDNLPCILIDNIDESYYKTKYELAKQTKLTIHNKLSNNENSVFYDSNAKEIILKDLAELRSCINAKAYKAAIIMAGSILEAFLIDWLSELRGNNYFHEAYMIYDEHLEKNRRADLIDYINELQDIKKSSWVDAAKKATEIRKKRNLVHATLYINNNDISKETCTEILDYLEYVINTRWKIK